MNFTQFLSNLFLLVVISSTVHAQTGQGVFRLGGDMSFDQQKVVREVSVSGDEEEYNSSIFMIRLKPGYFLADQVLVGADLGYTTISFDGESAGSEFLIGPHLSYYVKSGNSELFFPLTVYGGYVSQRINDFFDPDMEDVISGIYYGANIGLEYIPGNNLGINITFGPHFNNYTDEIGGVEIKERITTWQVRFGVNYYFTKSAEEE